MTIVNLRDVRISQVPDSKNPDRQISILDYRDLQYELVRTFSSSQFTLAHALQQHLNEQNQGCLVVKDPQQYSVWIERNIAPVRPSRLPQTGQSAVIRAQLYLLDGLWTEVRELLGTDRAATFGTEILASLPSIRSITYLSATIFMAKQPTQSTEIPNLSLPQLAKLYQEIQRLGGKYLGKNYAIELITDLQQGLPSQLKQELQTWLKEYCPPTT